MLRAKPIDTLMILISVSINTYRSLFPTRSVYWLVNWFTWMSLNLILLLFSLLSRYMRVSINFTGVILGISRCF